MAKIVAEKSNGEWLEGMRQGVKEVEEVEYKGSRERHRERCSAPRHRAPTAGSRKQRASAVGYGMPPCPGFCADADRRTKISCNELDDKLAMAQKQCAD